MGPGDWEEGHRRREGSPSDPWIGVMKPLPDMKPTCLRKPMKQENWKKKWSKKKWWRTIRKRPIFWKMWDRKPFMAKVRAPVEDEIWENIWSLKSNQEISCGVGCVAVWATWNKILTLHEPWNTEFIPLHLFQGPFRCINSSLPITNSWLPTNLQLQGGPKNQLYVGWWNNSTYGREITPVITF